jgi:hypothetical protein
MSVLFGSGAGTGKGTVSAETPNAAPTNPLNNTPMNAAWHLPAILSPSYVPRDRVVLNRCPSRLVWRDHGLRAVRNGPIP